MATPPVDRAAAALAIESFLRAIGRDPADDAALAGTGARVAAAFVDELCAGYAVDPDAVLEANAIELPSKCGAAGAGDGDVVVLRNLAVATVCPHHLLPAMGTCDVAFEAAGRIAGFGAIAQVVEAFAKRLALQESIGRDVVNVLARVLAPSWALVRLDMAHGCMIVRDGQRHGSKVVTFAYHGDPSRRDEAYRALGAR